MSLVGHSSGGPYMRVFAERYPSQVAGMVLLDAQPADAFRALPDYPSFYSVYRRVITLAPSLARVGVGFLLGSPADPSGIRRARSTRDEVTAQDRLVDLSTNVAHRVIPIATHDSVMVGADASASSQAILDVVNSVRTGSPVR